MAVEITEKAHAELMKLDVGPDRFLRLDIVPGGCSGMTYKAALDSALRPDDEIIYEEGPLRIVADAGSVLFLDGLKIDYSDDLIRSGFRFLSPKSVQSCGCGASFAV